MNPDKNKQPEERSEPGLRRKAAFSTVTVICLIVLAELILRIWGFEYETGPRYLAFQQDKYLFEEAHTRAFEKDDFLFWRLIPNNPKLGINSQGFRGLEVAPAKPPGKKRILCLGCSVTFGLAEPLSYADLLEQQLNREARTPRFEVLNLGVPGYSTFQGLRLLERACTQYKPDLITWLFGWNDHWLHGGLPDKEQNPPSSIASTFRKSRIIQFLEYLLGVFKEKPLYRKTGPGDFRVSLEDYRSNLKKAVGLCRQNDVEILFITAPTSIRRKADAPEYLKRDGLMAGAEDLPALHASYNHALLQLAAEMNVPVADCAEAVKLSLEPLMMRDGIHPNAKGHGTMARVVLETIKEASPAFLNE
ncbi:MAG: SGNH/GDSL hydrolase family protein [Planctomycetota bacterium]|jgi:lysophospholipase L1-like esterase